ncbi:class II fumarate hydratase [Phycisphaerales bacterium AB-hyl4]|uniref:Fumarate hydratase class II n=1 Tax=Natronomicrosphaera hydrolytica TaxID=3242702 RepID=A0ABV4U0K7_9BACT
MSEKMRIEKDSMGEMQVPEWALWGASTQRARENFPIAHRGVPSEVVHAFGHLKAACAQANADLGKLDKKIAQAIIDAATEVAQGKLDDHFVVDIYQTGSGTSTNMNANEVIAHRATQLHGSAIHPNDHVNMGQSSNDTFPTAMHIAAAVALKSKLTPALQRLHDQLDKQAKQWDDIIKIGRTHLMDATPIRVGQVFSGYTQQAKFALLRAGYALEGMRQNMPIGGTAVGTGINTHPDFGSKVCTVLSQRLDIDFVEAENHREAQAAADCFVQAHACLKTIAVSLSKIANDIRWLGSGPRCGLGELQLPAIQPGSSIMPGKVNPVICESAMQVSCRVIGNDATITTAGLGGVGSLLELNVAMPVMTDAMLESINLLANVANVFVDKLLVGLEVNAERCTGLIEQSLMMCTSLAPEIGYDNAAKLAKQAFNENKTIRELVLEQKLIPEPRLNELLDPRSMTEPGEG